MAIFRRENRGMSENIRTSEHYPHSKKVANKFGSLPDKHYLCRRFKCRWSFLR